MRQISILLKFFRQPEIFFKTMKFFFTVLLFHFHSMTSVDIKISSFATLYFRFHWEITIKLSMQRTSWPICIILKSPDVEFHRASSVYTRGSVKSVTDLKKHTITHIKLVWRWNRIWVSDDILSSYTVEKLSKLHNFHLRSFTY